MKVFESHIAVFALSLFFLFSPCHIYAQSGVNSPYSRYGLGLLEDQSTGITKAMGGIGAGFRQPNTLNFKNPASYSAVDTLTFIADLGFALKNGNYNENGVKMNARNASFSHMAMQFRILPKVGMTIGFLPFSNIGYNFFNQGVVRRDEDGEIKVTNSYTGAGGVRQVMGGLGWRPTKWMSLGVNASYLSGNMTHTINSIYSSADVKSRIKIYDAEMAALKLDFGLQSTIPIAQNSLVIGLTYSPAQNLESETYITDVHSISDTIEIDNAFSLPELLSAGFSYKWKNSMLGADVSYQTWSKALFFGEGGGCDKLSAAVGFMTCPDASSKSIFKRTSYQLGANFSQPYIMAGDKKGPMQFGVSAGFSLPITTSYNSMSYLHVSGEYVRVQPMEKGMITENYIRINVGVTFMERWFMKLMVD